MRLLQSILSALLLISSAFSAKEQTSHAFNDWFRLSQHATPIRLSQQTYKSLVAAPRDYSAAIVLTALENRFNCQLCRDFQPEWELLGKSWTKGDKRGDSGLIFGTLDFVEGREIFIELGLQTAPVLLLFPPTTGPFASASAEPIRYDFTGGPSSVEVIHAWLSRQLPDRPHPPFQRPINYLRWIFTGVFVLGALTTVTALWPYIVPIIQSRAVWAAGTMIAILMFTSGHMFNHIRKVPYVTGDGKGGIQYFVGGFQSQLGLETQIVAAIYGFMAFSLITLIMRVPRISDARTQTITSLVWVLALFVAGSFLLSIFRIKNPGYPFSLPPFM